MFQSGPANRLSLKAAGVSVLVNVLFAYIGETLYTSEMDAKADKNMYEKMLKMLVMHKQELLETSILVAIVVFVSVQLAFMIKY